MNTRKQLEDYAVSLCLALWERTAARLRRGEASQSIDNAGYTATFLENFCRPLWGLAPILKEKDLFLTVDGEKLEVCAWLRTVLAQGTRPGGWDKYRASLGDSFYANQLTTELAGYMVGAFWAEEKLWAPFSPEEKVRIARWLYGLAVTAFDNSWPNNHYWFPMLILLVLKRFGFCGPRTNAILTDGLERLDAFYLGGGWFQDGEFGRFDYYIAWSHHFYPLLWTLIETEDFPGYRASCEKYRQRTEAFLPWFAHSFDRAGCNVAMGRSLAYRFAASAIFPLAVAAGCRVDPGLARNVLLKNVSFFQENMHMEPDGVLSPGFLYPAPGFVENYTSDGGAYWSSKAFTALLLPEGHPFWTAPLKPLPIDQGDFIAPAQCPRVHMTLVGDTASGSVQLFNNTANYVQHGVLGHQFNDLGAYYAKFVYHSQGGFGLSVPNNRSIDSMIALATRDLTMCSHRIAFTDLGEENGLLVSEHFPFSNDPSSRIRTWMGILPDGYHFCAHQVTLGQPYWIQEGGFSLGFPTDYKAFTPPGGRRRAFQWLPCLGDEDPLLRPGVL